MRQIKRLENQDMKDLVRISTNAYPGMKISSEEDKRKLEERLVKAQDENPIAKLYGLFEDGELLGGMRFFDFDMTLRKNRIKAGGIGFVAVDLLHKKEKIARDMIYSFLEHYRNIGVNMCVLYPFRPDFYKKMGFGFGTKMNQYRLKPMSFPKKGTKDHLNYLYQTDKYELIECFNRFAAMRNGMIQKYNHETDGIFNNNANKIIGYRKDNRLMGYMIFEFKSVREGNPHHTDLHVKEIIYENRDVLHEFMTFFNSQEDQINSIIIETQDENFHYILSDPRNGTGNVIPFVYHESNVQGVGIMYRIVNLRGIFNDLSAINFGMETLHIKLSIADDFLHENNENVILAVVNGRAEVVEQEIYDVEIKMHISDFSSMLVGAVSLKALYNYGLVSISDESYIDKLNSVFYFEDKPICMTGF